MYAIWFSEMWEKVWLSKLQNLAWHKNVVLIEISVSGAQLQARGDSGIYQVWKEGVGAISSNARLWWSMSWYQSRLVACYGFVRWIVGEWLLSLTVSVSSLNLPWDSLSSRNTAGTIHNQRWRKHYRRCWGSCWLYNLSHYLHDDCSVCIIGLPFSVVVLVKFFQF